MFVVFEVDLDVGDVASPVVICVPKLVFVCILELVDDFVDAPSVVNLVLLVFGLNDCAPVLVID